MQMGSVKASFIVNVAATLSKVNLMKALIRAALISCALAAPALAFAQSDNGPVTRAEVRADLVQLEAVGYHPSANDPYYPADIQAAEAKVAAQNHQVGNASFGGVSQIGTSQSGSPITASGGKSIYFGH
jgi:hypothetical protein